MNRKLRIISAVLVVVLTLGMGAGASAEYVGINPEEHNTVLKVDQQQLQRSTTGSSVELIAFQPTKKLFPGVYEEGALSQYIPIRISEKNYDFWEDVKNSVDDIVVVSNTSNVGEGSNEEDFMAYVRTIFAFPAFSEENDEVHLNFHKPNGVADINKVLKKVQGLAEINGQNYKLYVYNYSAPLAAGDTSEPSLLEYAFDKNVTTEMIDKFGDKYEVLITSQAVQVTGFSTIAEAFGVTFSDVTADNHPWKTSN